MVSNIYGKAAEFGSTTEGAFWHDWIYIFVDDVSVKESSETKHDSSRRSLELEEFAVLLVAA